MAKLLASAPDGTGKSIVNWTDSVFVVAFLLSVWGARLAPFQGILQDLPG
jgi:hypothetical protein